MWRTTGPRTSWAALLCGAGLLSACGAESPGDERTTERRQAMIYGENDLREYGEFEPSHPWERVYLQAANATGALMDETLLTNQLVGGVDLGITEWFYELEALGTTWPVCPWETGWGQPRLPSPVCTAFLVDSDMVATAAHCVQGTLVSHEDSLPCHRLAMVFGFVADENGSAPTSVDPDDVYECVELVDYARVEESDWALLRLNHVVTGRTPVTLNRTTEPVLGAEVFMVGHPKGLPLKIAKWGTVYDKGEFLWESRIDSNKGNSGSPVFNLASGAVAGIHSEHNTATHWWWGPEGSLDCVESYQDSESSTVDLPKNAYALHVRHNENSLLPAGAIEEITD
jgi:hypothetical protein